MDGGWVDQFDVEDDAEDASALFDLEQVLELSLDLFGSVLVLDRDAFSRCLPENSSMSYNIMRGLVQRLRHADRKIESLALMDVYGRVARSLIEFAVDDGLGNLKIRDKISRQDLAKMVGASREMVSRVMKDLEERGFVQTQADGSMLVKERLSSLT